MQPAYFDAATAVPLHPAGRQALVAALEDGWADPGKLYTQARRARQLLEAAKATAADLLGVRVDELTFTSSGTVAAQSAVLGVLRGRRRVGQTFVHSAIEHSSVLHAAESHVQSGGSAVSVGVDQLGFINRDEFEEAVRQTGVAAAALISASHEVGTVQPVSWAAGVCASHGVPLFTDIAMTAGLSPVPAEVNLASASARKWGGPAGVGVLVVRKGTRWVPAWPAGEPAVDLPSIVAAVAALHAVRQEAGEAKRLSALVDRIRRTVPLTVPEVEVVGDDTQRLPHLVTFSCLYVDGEALLHALDKRGFAVSSGSSCTSSTLEPSHVLVAMKVLTHGNIRVSLHRGTTSDDVDRFLNELPGIVADLRKEVGM